MGRDVIDVNFGAKIVFISHNKNSFWKWFKWVLGVLLQLFNGWLKEMAKMNNKTKWMWVRHCKLFISLSKYFDWLFPGWLVCRRCQIEWPALSPDLRPMDFFCGAIFNSLEDYITKSFVKLKQYFPKRYFSKNRWPVKSKIQLLLSSRVM